MQRDFSVAQTVKNQEDSGSGRSPGEGNGNLLQYPGLENSMDRGACRAIYSPWAPKESNRIERLTHTSNKEKQEVER